MVRDGILYGAALAFLGAFAGYLAGWNWAAPWWLLAVFVLYFFRDPERQIPAGEGAVSPADGRIVDLRKVQSGGEQFWKISIFLSIFNVHVNRSPIDGIVRERSYQRGRFRLASLPEASVQNEQNTLRIAGVRTVTVKQIAGAVARRIVCHKKVGDRVRRGERIGLIKFGSRVDLLLPLDFVPCVAMGDRVRGGSTVLAEPWRASAAGPGNTAQFSERPAAAEQIRGD